MTSDIATQRQDLIRTLQSIKQPVFLVCDGTHRKIVSSVQFMFDTEGQPFVTINFDRKGKKEFTVFEDCVTLYLLSESFHIGRDLTNPFLMDEIEKVASFRLDFIQTHKGMTHNIVEYSAKDVRVFGGLCKTYSKRDGYVTRSELLIKTDKRKD